MLQDGIVSTAWIYENIFNFTDDEIKELDNEIVFDFKQKFRRSQIESEGNDPAKSGEATGTPSDMAMGRTGHELNNEVGPEGGSPEGGWNGAGRPVEPAHYAKDKHVRGRDPLGSHKMKRDASSDPKLGRNLALAHVEKLKGTLIKEKDYKLLNESEKIQEEYDEEVKPKV
jgi:hypothetical protein